jgi:branched-chain amino acid transport system ATP-binding protein
MFLELKDLRKWFGGVRAVDGASIVVKKGEVTSVIGPNGAGKTTLFNLITGFYKPDSGRVIFLDQDITGKPIRSITRMGISRSFQIVNVFPKLTVEENIMVAVLAQQHKSFNFSPYTKKMVKEECFRLLESLKLADSPDVLAGQLSHGAQKRLEVAIALAAQPKVLLLDEPTAGMANEEKFSVMDTIREAAKKQDITIFLCAHDMSIIFSISDGIWVMHNGKTITHGSVEEIRNNEEVHKIYLGERRR